LGMNVLLPQPIESEAVDLLEKAGCTVTVAPDLTLETVLPLMKEAHGLILRTGITVTRDLLAGADKLQVISRTGGGLDNVDVAAATEKAIIVTSNLGVNTVSVAEHVLALMLSLSKKLQVMDRALRRGDFRIRYQNLPRDLHGKTLGLLGFGRIGSEIGRACRRIFDMRVIASDPYLPDEIKASYKGWVTFVALQELFPESDFISIHVPLTDETRHLVGASELRMMKNNAILINTSRGGVVDETALIQALRGKKLAERAWTFSVRSRFQQTTRCCNWKMPFLHRIPQRSPVSASPAWPLRRLDVSSTFLAAGSLRMWPTVTS
jgi:D-3-phosphoglycerate dehydrogenase